MPTPSLTSTDFWPTLLRDLLRNKYLDDVARAANAVDRFLSRTVWGRHSLFSHALLFCVLMAVWDGPTLTSGFRFWSGVVVALVIVVGWGWTSHLLARSGRPVVTAFRMQLSLIAAVGLFVWFTSGPLAREADGHLYRHVILAIVGVFTLSGLAACSLSTRLFDTTAERDCLYIAGVASSNFVIAESSWWLTPEDLAWTAYREVIGLGHFVITCAAMAVVLSSTSERSLLLLSAGVVAVTICAALVFGAIRLQRVLHVVGWAFFKGTAMVVSSVVILLAGLRIWGVDYLTTVLDDTPDTTVIAYLAIGYVVSWWYDYWVTRLVGDRIIHLLGFTAPASVSVTFPADPSNAQGATATIEAYGGGRWLVRVPSAEGRSFDEHVWGLYDLFRTIQTTSGREAGSRAVNRLASKAFLYSAFVTALPVVLLALMYLLPNQPIQPELRASLTGSRGVVSPASMLFDAATCSERPVVVLAASGGGTRAALYTASVLQGLGALGLLSDVRLISGVSGGGAAAAYFASRRPELVPRDSTAWGDYFEQMQAPYIKDVLNGAGEWRMAADTRLGVLLSESFARRWKLAASPRSTFDQITDLGLMLNTSIAGTFDAVAVLKKNKTADQTGDLISIERRYREESTTRLAGGRLVLTNLTLKDDLTGHGLAANDDLKLPLIVVNGPGMSLADGAALNANFPPVFANAAVDVDRAVRYWVTDGGAVDNRGMEALLYAVRQGIDQMPPKTRCPSPPPIHMVVADASLFSEQYKQDRGIGAMMAAGSMLASQLASELAEDVTARYAAMGGTFDIHYIPMPAILRHSGSFGTNWMLQPHIRISRDPTTFQELTGAQVAGIIRAMHDSTIKLDADAARVLGWAMVDSPYTDAWNGLAEVLTVRKPAPQPLPH